jgi:hypothetical protein|tara:strand:+ start:321 stop:1856 length:1536 start_codon:yes stop_codon:yes gene_type:complete
MDNIKPKPPESQPTDLAPLDVIRTETVLSKFPIHNLTKRGSVDIHIDRKDDAGEVELRWKVDPNPAFGEPRQLAYKLDTLVINRRIDEMGRPIPRTVRLGSLRGIAKELGLGSNTKAVKEALLQNASAAITAKLNYKAKDGGEKWLEATFTRYSVIFTGGSLPGGRKSDAVYIILNDPYREILNNAPARPLNYDYLKELPPAAQRFYEIISFNVFAAIKRNQLHAKLLYSQYCTRAPQKRYYDYDHFKKQMYKVRKPHLRSGYIESVSYEATTDSEGNPDWIIKCVPGPKARAEYKTSNRRQSTAAEVTNTEKDQPEIARELTQQKLELLEDSTTLQAKKLVQYFYGHFHEVKKAHPKSKEIGQAADLITQYGPDQAKHVVNFSHRAAQETDYHPQTFGGILQYTSRALADYEEKTRDEKAWREEELRRQEKKQQEREQSEKEKQEFDRLLHSLPPDEQERIGKEVMENLKVDPFIGPRLREQGGDVLASRLTQAAFETEQQDILKRLKQT